MGIFFKLKKRTVKKLVSHASHPPPSANTCAATEVPSVWLSEAGSPLWTAHGQGFCKCHTDKHFLQLGSWGPVSLSLGPSRGLPVCLTAAHSLAGPAGV